MYSAKIILIDIDWSCRPAQCRIDRLCDLSCSTGTCQYAIDGQVQDHKTELDSEGGSNTQIKVVLRYQNNALFLLPLLPLHLLLYYWFRA